LRHFKLSPFTKLIMKKLIAPLILTCLLAIISACSSIAKSEIGEKSNSSVVQLVSKEPSTIKSILNSSRNATVHIQSLVGEDASGRQITSSGTGFFIAPETIVTCFHVISSASDNGVVNINKNIKILTSDDEELDAVVISIPTQQDPRPFVYDFAVLRLTSKPGKPINEWLNIESSEIIPSLGDDVVLSGFPLGTSMMATEKGTMAGFFKQERDPVTETNEDAVICIQAPISEGNSGGALCNSSGDVIGIISWRLGRISPELERIRNELQHPTGDVGFGGFTVNGSLKELIDSLNANISTGIGYARSAKFLNDYLKAYPEMVRQKLNS
jgi:serine protease Do